jgi:glycosyltransferase involved in cell wall biosynthesis
VADAYLELNLVPEAAAVYERAAPTFDALGMRSEHAWALAQHAHASLVLGQVAAANARLAAARALYAAEENVVGEAMAVGVPCVVTDVGDAAMLVGDTGIVVPPENSPALAAGLLQMMNLPTQERQQYGEAAQRRIEASFSIEVARLRFEQVYRQENMNIRGRD